MAALTRNVAATVLVLAMMLSPSHAAFVNWKNCLPDSILNANKQGQVHLQWIPADVWVSLNETDNYNLNMTVYGNVTGQATQGTLEPGSNHSFWNNPNQTLGKIIDLDPTNDKWSTMFAKFGVLDYVPYGPQTGVRFCNSTLNTECPIGPVFNFSGPTTDLPAFTFAHAMGGSYGFTTINAQLRVVNGDRNATELACVTADITPYLGTTVENLLSYIPLLVLVLVGIATASAAIFSPWGTWDVFRWTSNYGRDAFQLRLITPGFGDCLQYIQFIVLSGSLSLNYPGFYQPVISQVGWSALMFNESFVTQEAGKAGITDGIYVVDGTYGLNTTSQLIGMASDQDMWAGTMIWVMIAILALVAIIQLGFIGRWIYRLVSKTQEEDLRAKNFPFSAGIAVRIVFNYFLLPIVALSMYQLVITSTAPTMVTVGFAAVTILVLLAFSGWLLYLIISARPRSFLFEDLPTLLLYGPLYNTYSDNAATFALVPVVITFLRGIAIGAVQPSGIAQIILLAICEIITIMTLNAFRPFSSPTSMNAYHTVFSVVRLFSILLMIAFVPSLGIDDTPRGWIGYVILLMHAITLFVGFFLHSLQTLIEVIARLAGAGGEEGGTAIGGFVRVFGMRQLSRRNRKPSKRVRNSMASNSGILDQEKLGPSGTRSRSISASSNLLLNGPMSPNRQSLGFDSITGGAHSRSGSGGPLYTPTTPGAPASAFSYAAGSSQAGQPMAQGGLSNLKSMEPADPYFRAPRPRRVTIEMNSPGSRSRGSWASGDWTKVSSPDRDDSHGPAEGPSVSGRATPIAGIAGRERSDSNADETGPKPDYATREVDYYYGVRGPALSHMPTRKLKTGPADPTGPVSSATGWFRGIFGGKTKEQGKGFEVIRSSRMPPQEREANENDERTIEPYTDEDGGIKPPQVKAGTRHFELDDEGDAVGGGTRHLPEEQPSPMASDDEGVADGDVSDEEGIARTRGGGGLAPILPDIDAGSSIHMPSRIGSKASSRPSRANTRREVDENIPEIPRKSSKRNSSYGPGENGSRERGTRLSVIAPSPPGTPKKQSISSEWPLGPSNLGPQRLPFTRLSPNSSDDPRMHVRSPSGGSAISVVSAMSNDGMSEHTRHSSTVLGGFTPAFGARDERPSSMGYVQQHRASDNLHIVQPGEQAISGSAAELVDDNSLRSSESERPSR